MEAQTDSMPLKEKYGKKIFDEIKFQQKANSCQPSRSQYSIH